MTRIVKTRRGFGLIDVSLGIIAGVVLLIGGIILFNQINTNSQVTDVTRSAVAISSEIRAAARNLERFDDLDIAADLTDFGLEPGLIRNVTFEAEEDSNEPDSFTLTFTGLRTAVCNRVIATPANLGLNATTSGNCGQGEATITYTR